MTKRRYALIACAGAFALARCSNGDMTTMPPMSDEARSWWIWHGEKRAVDRVVSEAINEPGGGDYVRAVEAIRNSDRPAVVKQKTPGCV